MNRDRWPLGMLAGIVALCLLAACGSDGGDDAGDGAVPTGSSAADLEAAAEGEGQLLWYTALSSEASDAVVKAFESKYPGISVEVLRNTTSNLWQRFQSENAAGRNVADVVGFADWGV